MGEISELWHQCLELILLQINFEAEKRFVLLSKSPEGKRRGMNEVGLFWRGLEIRVLFIFVVSGMRPWKNSTSYTWAWLTGNVSRLLINAYVWVSTWCFCMLRLLDQNFSRCGGHQEIYISLASLNLISQCCFGEDGLICKITTDKKRY